MIAHPLARLVLAIASLLWAAVGCARSEPEPVEEPLVIFAAASLREAFGGMADELRKARPTANITFEFAGTQEIRTQLEQGAVADVFAAADERHMQALRDAGGVEAPTVFAENEPVVVVTKDKADTIRALVDLPRAERIVIGTPEVPIGRYTLRILDQASQSLGADFRARVEARVVSRELDVRQVLRKVSLGEADAGIVYRSDVAAAGNGPSVVTVPPPLNVIAKYPIAVVRHAPHPALARAWVALVTSAQGQAVLQRFGFRRPAAAEAAR